MSQLISPITEGLFEATEWLKMAPGWYFPIRMTIASLPGGGLILHSPLRLSAALRAEVDGLGTVAFVVAPNTFHHLFAGDWKAAYPDAQLLAPPGLAKKRPDLTLDGRLPEDTPPSWAGQVSALALRGSKAVQEIVFHHVPSGTLLATDLLFNMHETRGPLSPAIFWMMGCAHPPAQSRAIRMVTKDKAAARTSLEAILALDFDRLVVAHGEVIETGGKAAVRDACAWLFEG